MARTDTGAALTEQHRKTQLQVRAAALRDFALLWPIWKSDDESSFGHLILAAMPLVRSYHQIAAAAAGSYFTAFRTAEGVEGRAAVHLAATIDEQKVTASLYVTGENAARAAQRAGRDAETARKTAFVRTSGAISRHILGGSRETLLDSIAADAEARGWARVTDSDPCAFCALLAGRGPVYKSETTAEFEAHDHCACGVEPFYKGSRWPGRGREFRKMYDQAISEASAAGELDRGTSNDLLNAFRRSYDASR